VIVQSAVITAEALMCLKRISVSGLASYDNAIVVCCSWMQISDTVDIDACRDSYYTNLFPLNPSGIIVSGPTAADLQLNLPAKRGRDDFRSIFFEQQQQPVGAATAAVRTGGAVP